MCVCLITVIAPEPSPGLEVTPSDGCSDDSNGFISLNIMPSPTSNVVSYMVNCSRNDCGTSLLNASNDSVVGTLVVPHGHSYVVNVYAVDSFGRLSCAVSSNAMVEDKAGMYVQIRICACKFC